jgi:hypothetical protein
MHYCGMRLIYLVHRVSTKSRSFEVIHTTDPKPGIVFDLPLVCYDGDPGDAHLLLLLSFPILDKEEDSCKAVGVELLILEANKSSFGVVSTL